MSKPRDLGKEQFWRATVADWQQSGLSVTAFCQQRQLRSHDFFRWRKVLAVRDQPLPAGTESTTASEALFVPVQLRPKAPCCTDQPFEIVLADRRLLRVPAGFDSTSLRLLLAVLEESSC